MTKSTDSSLIEDTEIPPEELVEDLVEDQPRVVERGPLTVVVDSEQANDPAEIFGDLPFDVDHRVEPELLEGSRELARTNHRIVDSAAVMWQAFFSRLSIRLLHNFAIVFVDFVLHTQYSE